MIPRPLVLAALALVPVSAGVAALDHRNRVDGQKRALAAEATAQSALLATQFERGRSISLLTAHNPAFAEVYRLSGTGGHGHAGQRARVLGQVEDALSYLSHLFPDAIGEACFIDFTGREIARSVRGVPIAHDDLIPDKSTRPFFRPAFELERGEVHQALPFVSKDTGDWVIPTASQVPTPDRRRRAIVHFDLTIESFRRELAAHSRGFDVRVLDAGTGAVVIDSRRPQRRGGELGVPSDRSLAVLARRSENAGFIDTGDRRAAFARVRTGPGNANRWIVAVTPRQAGVGGIGVVSIALIVGSALLLVLALAGLRSTHGRLEHAANTDALTGLGNRRRLLADLEAAIARGSDAPHVLALFDLDGFKHYNDTFGHPAGDALLARLGRKLADAVPEGGHAFRPGGDEFCVLAPAGGEDALAIVQAAAGALMESGEGFDIGCSHGAVLLAEEIDDSSSALALADRRMYAQKNSARHSADKQTRDVLLRAIAERAPDLYDHVNDVAALARHTAERLGLTSERIEEVVRAAELHDVGKVAIPDAILDKPGPLSEAEWAFMHRHTIIGERILEAAPSLGSVAPLVRSSHERWDGSGYPDGLAGDAIALGARIVGVCDAFEAMIADRPYRAPMSVEQAVDELRRCAGKQFDPAVVDAFVAALGAARAR